MSRYGRALTCIMLYKSTKLTRVSAVLLYKRTYLAHVSVGGYYILNGLGSIVMSDNVILYNIKIVQNQSKSFKLNIKFQVLNLIMGPIFMKSAAKTNHLLYLYALSWQMSVLSMVIQEPLLDTCQFCINIQGHLADTCQFCINIQGHLADTCQFLYWHTRALIWHMPVLH